MDTLDGIKDWWYYKGHDKDKTVKDIEYKRHINYK
jgi:hypothetical protein